MNNPDYSKPKIQRKSRRKQPKNINKTIKLTKNLLKVKKIKKIKLCKESKVKKVKAARIFNIKSIQFTIDKAITEKSTNDSLSKKRHRNDKEQNFIFERIERELCSFSKKKRNDSYNYIPLINFSEEIQNCSNSLKPYVEYLKFNIVSIGMLNTILFKLFTHLNI